MNIWQRLALLERRIAALEAGAGTDLIGVKTDIDGAFPNKNNPVNAQNAENRTESDRMGAYPVRRNGKTYWRMPAGAPIGTLKPESRKQRIATPMRVRPRRDL